MGSLADHRNRVEDEIRELEARIIDLRATRNTFTPIGQLPVELLLQIFRYIGRVKGKASTILPITWVSRLWRNVVIDCADFWRFLDNSSMDLEVFAEMWLARSKSSPISVRLAAYSSHSITLQRVLSESSRIASLRLSRIKMPDQLHNAWSVENYSSLKEMYLHDFTVIPRIFTSTGSTLQVLLLERCTFNFPSLLTTYSALTTLSIISPYSWISATVLMDRLAGMSTLKTLILEGAVDDRSLVPGTPHLSGQFCPRLSTLRLSRMAAHVQTWILKQPGMVRPQTATNCHFQDEHRRLDIDAFQNFIAILHPFFSLMGRRVPKTVDIKTAHPYLHVISIFYQGDVLHFAHNHLDTGSDGPDRLGVVGDVKISFTVYALLPQVLAALNTQSALDNVENIRIEPVGCVSSAYSSDLPLDVAEFIAKLPRLERIYLRTSFPFIKTLLTFCSLARQNPASDLNALEVVSINTTSMGPRNLDDVNKILVRNRKPIKTLICDGNVGMYIGLAERVVLSGSRAELQLGLPPPFWARYQVHPLASYKSMDDAYYY